jgi:hypothetical protein
MANTLLADIPDLVTGTLRDLGRPKFTQIAQNLQSYEVIGKWFKKDKVKFHDGYGVQRTLMTSLPGEVHYGGIDEPDTTSIPNLLTQMRVDYCHIKTSWGFYYQEVLANRGKSLIVNVIEPRRAGALIRLAEALERTAWQAPATSADLTVPFGLPYWVVYNASTGFTGGAASGHTTVAGVNLTDNPTFKNYSVQYTNVTKTDLIKKLRRMHQEIRWESPLDVKGDQGSKMRLYCDWTVNSELEDIGEGQNENLGRDLAPMGTARDVRFVDDVLTFRRHPIRPVKQLDDTAVYTAATSPVYMIDHDTFYPICLEGDYLRESDATPDPVNHNAFQVFLDLSNQYICDNRRRNGIAAK